METAYDTNHCFGCGRDNPIGLKLDMKMEGDTAWLILRPRQSMKVMVTACTAA